jgi:beta-phosphoglucomutase
MSTIETVIFDLDGVIVSTDELHYLAWKKIFDSLGIKFDRQDNEKIKGVGRRESFEAIAGNNFNEKKIKTYLKWKNEYYVELLNKSKLMPLPGIIEFMETLTSQKIMKAIASASKNAMKIMDNLGIAKEFNVIVDGTMCSKGKPEPEIFLLASQMLGKTPAKCLVIEDSQAGINAAKAAGMKSIGIGKYLKNADIILASTKELNTLSPLKK